METYYDILEIKESATPEEIKQAYRLLLEVWHPDRFHHKPKLLAKAEQKSGIINKAFETLGTPELKQQYDAWLQANRNWGVQSVGAVTCPSCQTSFFSNPERNEEQEFHANRRRAKKDSHRPAGAIFDGNEFFTPVRMGVLAVALLFAGIIVFTLTKSSKVIVSYKPAQPVEAATLPQNEPLAFEVEEQIRQTATVRDGGSNRPVQPHEKETFPRSLPKAETQQERSGRLETMQRLMAQAPGRSPASPEENISAVDLEQLKMRGAQGNASAQNQLGQLYDQGRRGVPQDYTIAQGWYEKAAAQGNGWAQNQLGQMSADGRGMPQDYNKARQWWEQAAAQGIAQAQYNLGQLYANGRGVPQDYTTARGWYEKAAAQGNAWAQAQLGQLYANGLGVPKDYTMARVWYEKAAAKGNVWAQAQLILF
ncbi:MAG: SEL1-like repeat protein [Nitrospirae bacterium]|nr:SEL1-like repeat protein [Nitrospirota bacterium]